MSRPSRIRLYQHGYAMHESIFSDRKRQQCLLDLGPTVLWGRFGNVLQRLSPNFQRRSQTATGGASLRGRFGEIDRRQMAWREMRLHR